MARENPRGYSMLQILLHWAIAVLIIFQLFVNDGMQLAFGDRMDGNVVEDGAWALLHIAVGLAVLALAVARVVVRLMRGAPIAHDDKPALINWAGFAVHGLLYAFIFLMPITGLIAWFGASDLAAEAHEIGRLLLILLIILHVVGAFAEHFVFRNDTLLRMFRPAAAPGSRKPPAR